MHLPKAVQNNSSIGALCSNDNGEQAVQSCTFTVQDSARTFQNLFRRISSKRLSEAAKSLLPGNILAAWFAAGLKTSLDQPWPLEIGGSLAHIIPISVFVSNVPVQFTQFWMGRHGYCTVRAMLQPIRRVTTKVHFLRLKISSYIWQKSCALPLCASTHILSKVRTQYPIQQ